MTNDMNKGKRKFGSIFLKVYGGFTAVILLFALLLGAIFIRMYTESTKKSEQQKLNKAADSVAAHMRAAILDENYSECIDYMSTFSELEDKELWVLANKDAQYKISDTIVNHELQQIELQSEFDIIIENAYKGISQTKSFLSDMHEATTMATGKPLVGPNKEIVGALVIISTLEEMDSTISSCRNMILLSAIAAIVISAALAMAVTKRITNPIREMRKMASEMMEGNYKCKTGIDRNDEIGDMARSIDMLSDKLLENEVERRNIEQMRLDFFANVSHELRTPIAVVRAYTETLVDGVVTEEEKIRQYYARILSECKSMERLVGDLLTLSKMQNPNFTVEKEPVNLIQVFEEITRSATAIAAEKNIKIKMNHEKDVYLMMGDYDRLRQMFIVIFDNAIKFSPENSTITVKIESGEELRVSIKDEGIGISPEELPNIFEKFYKSKLRQNAKGTGLGLAIAKYIVLKHDGRIEVNSEVGKGTEFVFYFKEVFEEDLTD